MLILPKEGINFIIALHLHYGEGLTGGIVAMHKLSYELAVRGYNVFIFTEPAIPHSNIKTIKYWHNESTRTFELGGWEPFTYMYNNTVTVYPQIVKGNPIGTKHVSRWLQFHLEEKVEDTFDMEDVYFNFGNFSSKRQSHQKLTVIDYNKDSLYKTNYNKRKGFCYIHNKDVPTHGYDFVNTISDKDLSNWRKMGCYEYLRENFNNYEYLLTYDRKSFFPLAAAMCGCKTIILEPNTEISPDEQRNLNPLTRYGVAYGWDDIQWANQTIDLATDYVDDLIESDSKTIDNFIEFWKNRCQN